MLLLEHLQEKLIRSPWQIHPSLSDNALSYLPRRGIP